MPMLEWKQSGFNVIDCLPDPATFDARISKGG
jgi:hypothetical protein